MKQLSQCHAINLCQTGLKIHCLWDSIFSLWNPSLYVDWWISSPPIGIFEKQESTTLCGGGMIDKCNSRQRDTLLKCDQSLVHQCYSLAVTQTFWKQLLQSSSWTNSVLSLVRQEISISTQLVPLFLYKGLNQWSFYIVNRWIRSFCQQSLVIVFHTVYKSRSISVLTFPDQYSRWKLEPCGTLEKILRGYPHPVSWCWECGEGWRIDFSWFEIVFHRRGGKIFFKCIKKEP